MNKPIVHGILQASWQARSWQRYIEPERQRGRVMQTTCAELSLITDGQRRRGADIIEINIIKHQIRRSGCHRRRARRSDRQRNCRVTDPRLRGRAPRFQPILLHGKIIGYLNYVP